MRGPRNPSESSPCFVCGLISTEFAESRAVVTATLNGQPLGHWERFEPTARDDATMRAAMRHDPTCLVTVTDYEALPCVAGVEDHAGEGKITIYRERWLPIAALERLQRYVDERKTLNLLVTWKVDRRQAERRRRSASPDGPPPIPSEARWA